MSRELRDLLHKIQVKRYKESPPKKILYWIFSEVEEKKHYGRMRSWEIMVELLAQWIVKNEDLTLASMCCKAFEGLPPPDKDLYQQIDNLDLFKHYVIAAKQNPWDHIGEIYQEQRLTGPGQNMTPKAVVDFMIEMLYGGPPKQLKTQLDTLVGCTKAKTLCWNRSFPF